MRHYSNFLSYLIIMVVLLSCGCTDQYNPVDENREADVAREVNAAVIELNNLAAAVKYFRRDFGGDPGSVNSLYPYLVNFRSPQSENLDSLSNLYKETSIAQKWWDFRLINSGDNRIEIDCISNEAMSESSGHRISYNLSTAQYSGYGLELVYTHLFPYLLEYFIDPKFIIYPGAECDPEKMREHYRIVRQVNWAAASIGAIYNGLKMYRQDCGEEPPDPDELEELEYLETSPPVKLWWNFAVTWNADSPPNTRWTAIHAVSSEMMAGGAGDTLTFDLQTGEFGGAWHKYLSPAMEAKIWDIPIFIKYVKGAREKG